jgi:hypothetical protein
MLRARLVGGILPLLFAGCSLGADEEPPPVSGAAREIAALVRELERATARGDFATVCEELFTATARRRAGGEDCERLVRSSAGEVRAPRIQLRAVELRGSHARARVRTRAAGQALLDDVLELRRRRGEWRIAALAG